MWPNTKDWVFDIIGIDPGSKCTVKAFTSIISKVLELIE